MQKVPQKTSQTFKKPEIIVNQDNVGGFKIKRNLVQQFKGWVMSFFGDKTNPWHEACYKAAAKQVRGEVMINKRTVISIIKDPKNHQLKAKILSLGGGRLDAEDIKNLRSQIPEPKKDHAPELTGVEVHQNILETKKDNQPPLNEILQDIPEPKTENKHELKEVAVHQDIQEPKKEDKTELNNIQPNITESKKGNKLYSDKNIPEGIIERYKLVTDDKAIGTFEPFLGLGLGRVKEQIEVLKIPEKGGFKGCENLALHEIVFHRLVKAQPENTDFQKFFQEHGEKIDYIMNNPEKFATMNLEKLSETMQNNSLEELKKL